MTTSQFYELRAKALIKELRAEQDISYKTLARRLHACGVRMDPQALINRINRGKFSFAFALQLLSAMGVESLPVPKPPQSSRSSHTQ